MKRPSINFSKEGVKEFFFRHGEKVFFGLACALIVLFFWLGFKTPAFRETTPSAMLNTAGEADRYIKDTSNWDKIKEYREADTEAADRIAKGSDQNIASLPFKHLSGTAVLTRAKRTDPNFLAAENFETRFFRAQVVLQSTTKKLDEKYLTRGPNGLPNNEDIVFPPEFRYLMWVYRPDKHKVNADTNKFITADVVYGTALIPHAQQIAEYDSKFQFARGYDDVRDTPEYAFLEVQRKTKDTDWVSITAHVHEVTSKTHTPAKDLSDPRYTVDNVTLEIPPFLGFDYRGFSIHDSVPPLDVLGEIEGKKDDSESEQESGDDNVFGSSRGSGGDKDKEKDTEKTEADTESEDDEVPFKVVRFYDLEEKTLGESYMYRIRVWMRDPNNPDAVNSVVAAQTGSDRGLTRGGDGAAGGGAFADSSDVPAGGAGGRGGRGAQARNAKPLREQDLAYETRMRVKSGRDDFPADIADRFGEVEEIYPEENSKYLVPGEWAEAENWVTITKGFETFAAGPVRAPTLNRVQEHAFATTEPSMQLVATSFQDDLGIGVPATAKVFAGSVLNFRAVTNVLHPITWEIKEVYESKDERRGDKIGRKFTTDAVVLDIMGGQRQPFSRNNDVFFAPGEVLIMDRNGNFVLRNDIDDETVYRQANFVSEENSERLKEKDKKDDKDDGGAGRGGGGDDGGDN